MRNTVLTVVSSSSSSILIPPNSPHISSVTKSSHSKSSSVSAKLSHSKTSSRPLLSTVRWDLAFHRHQNRLKYYAQLASKVAEGEKMDDFLLISESVLKSGVKASEFAALLDVELVSKGFLGMLQNGKVDRVVEVLSAAQKLGFCPSELFDGNATEGLRRECSRVGEVEEVVEYLEILGGTLLHF